MSYYNNSLLSNIGLNTLTFTDPYAKLCFNSMMISQYYHNCQQQKKKIIYIDLDTTFTAYLHARLLSLVKNTTSDGKDAGIVCAYLPTEGTFELILKHVIYSMSDSLMVIFDSVNSFYNMYHNKIFNIDSSERGRIGRLNHLLSIFLMLLVKHGIHLDIPVLATSMIRYKIKDGEWKMSLTSKRILQKNSVVNLYVEILNNNNLSVKLTQHPSIITPQTFIFNNEAIKV